MLIWFGLQFLPWFEKMSGEMIWSSMWIIERMWCMKATFPNTTRRHLKVKSPIFQYTTTKQLKLTFWTFENQLLTLILVNGTFYTTLVNGTFDFHSQYSNEAFQQRMWKRWMKKQHDETKQEPYFTRSDEKMETQARKSLDAWQLVWGTKETSALSFLISISLQTKNTKVMPMFPLDILKSSLE